MKEAIFADVGVALLAIFNSMRILRTIKDKPKESVCEDNSCSDNSCSTEIKSEKKEETTSCCSGNSCCS